MLFSQKNHPLIFLIISLMAILPATVSAQENKSCPPSKFPDRIILGWKGDAAHSQAVNWRTDSTITKAVAMIHEADPSPDFQSSAKNVEVKTQEIILDGKRVKYHEADFTGLKTGNPVYVSCRRWKTLE